MKRQLMISILAGILAVLAGCEKEDVPKGTPKCIEKKINTIAGEPVWNPPAKVYSYEYNGQTVYYFPQRCCDIASQLYDENCNFLCAPDGGFSGAGDGQCTDFFSKRTDAKLIWEDDRK